MNDFHRFDRHQVCRRTLLRGAGVAMALPWLESIPVWGLEPSVDGEAQSFPKRFAALFMACGVNPDHWWAKGSRRRDGIEFQPAADETS